MSATATPPAPKKERTAPPAIVRVEQHICPKCEGVVKPTHVAGNNHVDPNSRHTFRHFKIYCGHCDLCYERRFRLQSGELVADGDIAVLTGKRRASFLARVAYLDGDRVVEPNRDEVAADDDEPVGSSQPIV